MIKSIVKSAISYTAVIGLSASLFLVSSHSADAQGLGRRKVDVVPTNVEIAYKKGLKFLAKMQASDGSFSKDRSRYGAQPGITGICVLAFLAHGEDGEYGPYAKNIKKGIDFILKQQNKKNGYIGLSMYNHGFATLALAEAYGMVDDDRLAGALKKSVSLLTSSQDRNPKGAWRYSPEDMGADTTVAGCQLVALLAARNAGIPVPNKNIDKALKYLASCRASNGGYGYTSKSGGKSTLTAIGSLCMSLAKKKDEKAFDTVTKFLTSRSESGGHHYVFYHEYYMAQALFHANEEQWEKWNEKNSKIMTASQNPDGGWSDPRLGRSGATGFALLSMALNYRFLPIYEK
ncbi:MAG: prenyltransferase beta subunit [Cryomorphaceae bacterium]|jgi:prenyltransferase beta subunit